MDKQVQGQNQTNQQNKKRSNNSLYLILLLLLGISLGFAALTTQLNILGNTTVTKQKWDVHFDNVQITDAKLGRPGKDLKDAEKDNLALSDIGTAALKDGSTTEVEFNARLDLPTDYFEFTVDVVNAGSVDAMLSEVTNPIAMTTTGWDDYLDYTVTYADTDSTAIAVNDKLSAGSHVTVKVRVTYKSSVDAAKLEAMEEDTTFASTYSMTYVQATTAANALSFEVANS